VALARLLAPAVSLLARDELDELRGALVAIGEAAERHRAEVAVRLEPAPSGWVSTEHAARVLGCSSRAVTRRIAAGTLPARRQGRRWKVDAAALAG
jgi:excisionase family DNA binding protein